MLEHINEPSCTDQERLHLEAVARFFRAYAHYSLVINYGDAIYVDHLLSDASEELTKSRDSRLYVADGYAALSYHRRWRCEHLQNG